MFLEGFGVGLGGDLHLGQIGFQAHPVPTGSLQVLGGADESAGAVVDGLAQGVEVAAGLRRQKDQRLLGLGGDGDKHAFIPRFAGPGLHASKPLRRGRIGGPAQEGDDQHKMRGLALGQVGMNPEPVSGQQVGDL